MSRAAPWTHRPLLIAPDAFKGTLTATDVADAIADGVESGAAGLFSSDRCPVADGGEGTMQVLIDAIGGEAFSVDVSDPLGRTVQASFAVLANGEALVEVAEASGLGRVAADERDAEAASSRGTGELIVAAVGSGARTVLVAAGGSATTDGGAGALEAIDEAGGIDGASLVVLSDVITPFELAADRFAPQKGADTAAVGRLRRRLEAFARRLPREPRGVPMTGAAGGLAGGLWAALGARLVPGGAFVLEALDFDARMRASRAVVVGEGRIDRSTLEGKIAGEIATRARQAGVPAHAIVGENELDRFDARILDLQLVIEAGTRAELRAAGRTLAQSL